MSPIGEFCTSFFYITNVKRIILINCSSNFISFGPVERILETSEEGNVFLANPVY